MAHIPDGVLAPPVLLGGALVSAGLVALALRRLDYAHLPQAAVLSAAFFVSSLISVPLGPSSVHLLLNGLMGLLLGWTAVPALLVALTLQLVFFGHGGLSALGVNTLNIALPALVCAWVLRPRLARARPRQVFWIGVAAGAIGVLLTGSLVALTLGLSDRAFLPAAQVIALTFLPLALVESLITGTVLSFLHRVDPQSLPSEGMGHG
jgi:cobalt/nickel transport system permease protein